MKFMSLIICLTTSNIKMREKLLTDSITPEAFVMADERKELSTEEHQKKMIDEIELAL